MAITAATTRALSLEHLNFLASQAVDASVVEETCAWTAAVPDDLPESLRYRSDLPGIVFMHHRPDGSTVAQYRPDTPADDFPKYAQEADTGSIISLHPRMRRRLDALQAEEKPFHSTMVEGTKQHLAYVSHAPDTLDLNDGRGPLPVVAFGVQGCGNWSSEGAAVPDLDAVLEGAASVTVMFDADRETKYQVWKAGERFKDFAEAAFPEIRVLFARIPAGGSAGLDDVLGKRAEGEPRRRLILGIHKKATANMGRCPAQPKATRGKRAPQARIDWVNGLIYAPDVIHDVNGVDVSTPSSEVVAQFAARIVCTRQIIDDLNEGDVDIEHDLQVRFEGDPTAYEVLGVPDGMMRDVAYWRNRAGHGTGSRKIFDSTDHGQRTIDDAIRVFELDSARFVQAFKRTGWVRCVDDKWRYLTPSGAIGTDGIYTDAASRLDNSSYQKNIRIPDPSEYDATTHRKAVAEYISIGPDRLLTPTVWYSVVGAMAYASTGAAPRSGLIVPGKHGSGKTVVTQTAATAYGPNYHAEGGVLMGSMNGTGNAVGASGTGLHHMAVIVDDVRRRQSIRRQEEQDAAVEDLIRKTYEGGSAGRARQRVDRNRNGRIVTDNPDASCPLIIFTAEYVPSAEAVGSSVERLLSVPVTKRDTMKPGETEHLKAIGKSGRPAIAWSGWLRWQAQQIENLGSHSAWVEMIEARRVAVADRIREFADDLSDRARKVAAPLIVGWELLLIYATEIGAIESDRAKELSLDAAQRITKAAIRHTRVEMAEDLTGPERMLARLRALVSSGTAQFDGERADETVRVPVIGTRRPTKIVDPETGNVEEARTIALNPDAVAKLLGPGITGTKVVDDLKEKAVARPTTGRYGWKVTINGVVITNAVVIRESVWAGEGDDDE